MMGGYEGARRKRSNANWAVTSGSASADIIPDLVDLRERSRDLDRNHPLASGAVSGVVINAVGTGLSCHPQIDRELLGLSERVADAWQLQAWRIFDAWAAGTACDYAGQLHFNEMQEVALRSALVSGDAFGLKRFVPKRRVGFAVQLLEGDRCSTPLAMAADQAVRGGIRFEPSGRPSTFYFTKRHPGDLRPGLVEHEPVPAVVDGRPMVMHIYKATRSEQPRGVPYLAPVIDMLRQIGLYSQSEVEAAVVAGFFTVFIKSERGDDPLDAGGDANDAELKLGKGAIVGMRPGESIETANPGRPNANFDPFWQSMMCQVGVALDLPAEVLLKRFSASYSASKANLIEAWKTFRWRRKWLVQRFCQPCYEEVIGEAVARGMLAAPGFFDDELIRRAYLGTKWTGPAMGQIDPVKETAAAETMVANGWKTNEEVTAELTGGDWDDNVRRLARENAMKRDAGMIAASPVDESMALDDPDHDPADMADRQGRQA
jgi:lambda family phage portal protein